ncbi:MAG TPA: hypothetical protein VNU19_14890 [Candidatus Acidoferrum sp.]|jgi:hypothetical protein|nr:hypothetical protein [Candidatus Acidoferrum sp.]
MPPRRESSLQKTSLGSIFAPLDPDERLPREQLIQSNRNWLAQELGPGENRNWTIWNLTFGRQLVAGLLWSPAMLVVFGLTTLVTGSPLAAFAATGVLLLAFWRFAFAHHSH